MDRNNGYTRLVAALLFITVCAYLGAALWRHSGGDVSIVTARKTTVTDTVRISGIAVRTETPFVCDGISGKRIPASEDEPSGVYFADCDGFEYLSPHSINDIPALISAQPRETDSGRLVTESVWYFAAVCDAKLEPGHRYEVQFDGAPYPVSAKLCSSDGEYAVFRLNEGGDYFLSLRKCEAELVTSRHAGVQLPVSAVHTGEDGEKYVYICSSCVVGCAKVDIIYTDGRYCLVAGIDAGEQVVAAGRDIKEGMVIG